MNLLHLNAAAEGSVEMPESEAEAFRRAGWLRVDDGDFEARKRRLDPMIAVGPIITIGQPPSTNPRTRLIGA
jgi:hypothetical protein